MAVFASHQNNSATLLNTNTTLTVTITSVDRTKAWLNFTAFIDDSRPDNSIVSGQLTADTTITFTRIGTTGAVTIEWEVVEFVSGVSVQRGSTSLGGQSPPFAVTLGTPADKATSFIIWSQREAGSNLGADDFLFATLNDTDADSDYEEIIFDGQALPTATGFAEWQVITYDDCAVQHGTITFIASDTSKTATLSPAVDQAKTWLICAGFSSSHTTTSTIHEDFWRGRITSTTQITFDRVTAPSVGAGTISWFTVDFSDDTTVEEIEVAFGTGDTTVNDTVSAITIARSIITAAGFLNACGKTAYSADDDIWVAGGTLELTTTTNLRTIRALSGSATTDLTAYVVDFATVAAGANPKGPFGMPFYGPFGGPI